MDFHVKQQPYNMHLGQNLLNMGFSLFQCSIARECNILTRQGLECKTAVEFGKAFVEFNCSKWEK